MRITAGDELLAAVAGCEEWRGITIGLVDGAPDDAVQWLRVVTVDQAEKIINAPMFTLGEEYTGADGLAALVQACMEVREDDWTSEEYVAEQARPWFACAADLLEYGDPTMPNSRANVLLQAVLMAGGVADPGTVEKADSPTAFRERALGGRWVKLAALPGEPEVYVSKLTERHLTIASQEADREILVKRPCENQARRTRSVVSHVLLSGPKGAPLLTAEQVGQLPYGTAQFIEYVATDLGMGQGREPRVATFRGGQPVEQEPAGGGVRGVVVPGEATPDSGRARDDAGRVEPCPVALVSGADAAG